MADDRRVVVGVVESVGCAHRVTDGRSQRRVREHVVDRPAPRAVEGLAREDLAIYWTRVAMWLARVEDQLDGVHRAEIIVVVASLAYRQLRQGAVVARQPIVERPAGGGEPRITPSSPQGRAPFGRREGDEIDHAR